MFGFLKNILRHPPATPVENQEPHYPQPSSRAWPAPATAAPASPYRPPRPNTVAQHGAGIELSLQNILASLPLELQPRLLQQEVGDATISVPLDKVLAQLSSGTVKISFGDLRRAVPGLFSPEPDRDRVLVPLPLADVLARLNPALITRRRVQRHVEVPEEITSPFDQFGQGLIFSVGPGRREANPAPTAPRTRQGVPPVSTAPARSTIQSVPPPTLPAAQSPGTGLPSGTPSTAFARTQHYTPAPRTPSAMPPPAPQPPPLGEQRPISMPSVPRSQASMPTPQPPVGPAPSTPIAPIAPIPMAGLPFRNGFAAPPAAPAAPVSPSPATIRLALKPVQEPASVAPTPEPESAPAPVAESAALPQNVLSEGGANLIVGLTSLAEGWPEAVRKEIVERNLVDARVSLPMDAVEQALRLGRIAFSWKTLRSWLLPATSYGDSPQDSLVLELPLRVVAPLFLERQQEANKHKQKVLIDEAIPNLFFGFPQADPSAATVSGAGARPADTNYYVWDDTADNIRADASAVPRPRRRPGQNSWPNTRLRTRWCLAPHHWTGWRER